MFIVLSCLFWMVSYIYPNEINLNFLETSFIRGISGLLFSGTMCLYRGESLDIDPRYLAPVAIRSIAMVLDTLIFGLSQFFLPIPIVHTIGSTGTLFIVLLDYLINGVKLNNKQIAGLVISFAGMILVINGEWLITYIDPTYETKTDFQNYHSDNPFVAMIVGLALALNMLLWAYSCLCLRMVPNYSSNQWLAQQGVFLILGTAVFYDKVPQKADPMVYLIGIILIGIPSNLNFVLTTLGFQLAKNTSNISMLFFSPIIFGYVFSIFRYHESQNMVCLVGIILIVFGIAKTIINKA